jgi:CMP-N,N'-diacetyllegionaminic acid synthase
MASLAIIPARGGSKGVPGKNLRELAGKPLVAWSILRARAAEAIDTVVVSTDDERIAAVAREHGAEVPFLRPAALATDEAPTEPVMAHALDWYAACGRGFDTVALLQPTSPLRHPGTIDAAFRQLRDEQADSLLGVVESHHFHWRRDPVEALYDYRNRPRRQDIAPADRRYRESGSLYISTVEAFARSGNRLSGSIALFLMDELEGWEIDSEMDFAILEALFARIADAD